MAENFAQATLEQDYARQLDMMRRLQQLGQEEQEKETASVQAPDTTTQNLQELPSPVVQGQASEDGVVATQVQQLARKNILRALNGAMAGSIVFLGVAYLIWSFQLIFGNLLNWSLVPKLSLVEKVIWGVATLLLVAIGMAVAAIVSYIFAALTNPADAVKILGKEVIDIFKLLMGIE